MSDMNIVVLDLETTGTDPQCDKILEIAAACIDADLNFADTVEMLIPPGGDVRLELASNPAVYKMHEASGLIEALEGRRDARYKYTIAQADAELARWMIAKYSPGSVVLCGFSIQFDREFIKAQMPKTAKMLHHRIVDMSTLRTLYKMWIDPDAPKNEAVHRAMRDCAQVREEMLRFKELFLAAHRSLGVG